MASKATPRMKHRKWMDIEALHWNVSRNMNTSAGSAANREASEPTISEVILTKVSDSSSTKLFQEALKLHFPPQS
jgi:type VI secretion system secreted protein Hcp